MPFEKRFGDSTRADRQNASDVCILSDLFYCAFHCVRNISRTHVGGCSAEVVGHVIESFAEDGQAEIGDFDVEMIVGI